jgi:hypothetical protein
MPFESLWDTVGSYVQSAAAVSGPGPDALNDPLPVPVPSLTAPLLGNRSPIAGTFPMAFYGNARAGLTDFVGGKVPRVLRSYRPGYGQSRRFRSLRV